MKPTERELKIDSYLLKLSKDYRAAEARLIKGLQEMARGRSFRKFDCRSLFEYLHKRLGCTEDVA